MTSGSCTELWRVDGILETEGRSTPPKWVLSDLKDLKSLHRATDSEVQ